MNAPRCSECGAPHDIDRCNCRYCRTPYVRPYDMAAMPWTLNSGSTQIINMDPVLSAWWTSTSGA